MEKSNFLIAGKHAVTEALKNPNRKVLRVFLTEESKKSLFRENNNNILNDTKIFYKTKKELDRLCSKDQISHQGLIAEIELLNSKLQQAYHGMSKCLDGVANKMVFGQQAELEKELIDEAISQILQKELRDAKVVIKGCGNLQSRDYAFFELTKKLTPIVSSIMYGEPCSTVPVFKRKK